jgi:type II secretory pathway component PulK
MMRHASIASSARRDERGSAFIIILWIAFGLVSIALYFSHSMISELRASENRVAGVAADQAIQGAIRYINSILANQIAAGSNGWFPDPSTYLSEAVPVGDAHFWIIGRDTNYTTGSGILTFGLVDEASKLNLNNASSNMLYALLISLPNANLDMAAAILDWRDTNSSLQFQTYYSTKSQPYQTKAGPFESIDELRLVYGADSDTLVGDDENRNGVLDPTEDDKNHNGQLDAGILEYVTTCSREPNIGSNGTAKVTIQTVTGSSGPLPDLLQQTFGSSQADRILSNLGLVSTGAGRGAPGVPGQQGASAVAVATFRSPLEFYRLSQMSADDFGKIADQITVTNGDYITGRVNINTASPTILSSLPGFDTNPDLAQTVIAYREQNPDKLGSIAWIVDALGSSNGSVLSALQTNDCITVRTYQVAADVAAIGLNGRGYRRMRVVFDTCDGIPRVVYCQDLTHLGWALGKTVRDEWLEAKATR